MLSVRSARDDEPRSCHTDRIHRPTLRNRGPRASDLFFKKNKENVWGGARSEKGESGGVERVERGVRAGG